MKAGEDKAVERVTFIYPLTLSLSKGEIGTPLWFDKLTMSGMKML